MKRAAVDHPKLQRLQRRLQLTRFQAMGLLESLWHFTGRYAAQGDIGRWSDEEIASWIEWNDDPEELMETLVVCGWLDRDPTHRLLVHDWSEHADEATKVSLKRAHKLFCVPTVPGTEETVSTSVATVSRPPVPRQSQSQSQSQSHVLDAVPEAEIPADADDASAEASESDLADAEREMAGAKRAESLKAAADAKAAWTEFLLVYPPRCGDQGTKRGREKFLAALKGGVPPGELIDGAQRYRVHCDATQKTGTEYVQQISTWFGREGWKQAWNVGRGADGQTRTIRNGGGGSSGEPLEAKRDRLLRELDEQDSQRRGFFSAYPA